jgi:replicative DNA helicase
MPGVGKTQIALRFAAELRRDVPMTNIFFITATSKENLVQGFQRMHRVLQLAREPHQDTMIEVVRQWLVRHDD